MGKSREDRVDLGRRIISQHLAGTAPEMIAYYCSTTLDVVEVEIKRWLVANVSGNGRKAQRKVEREPFEVSIWCEEEGCREYAVDRFRGKMICKKHLTPEYDQGYILETIHRLTTATSSMALCIDEQMSPISIDAIADGAARANVAQRAPRMRRI